MGSTKVEAPAPRNLAQETSETLENQIRLAPQQLDAYQRTAPGYAQTDLDILGRSLFGEGFTGTLSDINRRLTDEAAAQTRDSNTQQRAADLADVERMSPAVLAAQRAANPELFGNLSRLDSMAGEDITPGAAESAFFESARRPGGLFSADTVSNAITDPGSPSAIEAALQQQALAELGRGDQLSEDEARRVRVQSRAAADARGRGFSNAALADEVLNTASARQARLEARRGFALTTNNALRSGQAADRGYGLARDQFRAGIDTFNAGMGLDAARFNASRTDADRAALDRAAQMEAARRGEGFGRQLSATQARLATFTDPFMGVLGRSSSNAGSNQALFGNAVGTAGASAQQTRGMFDPYNSYAQDLFSTNYNAQAAANIATAQNKSALMGAAIGAVGTAAGGFLGKPCWVARAVYGERDPRWTQFRTWLLSRAPQHLLARYLARGEAAAQRVKRDPVYRAEMRRLMDAVLALNSQPA